MKCDEANQQNMVEYLRTLGYQPQKIKGNDYWYHSPFRIEKEASFKIERRKNVWYDHGVGKGGKLIDFVKEYYHCSVGEALQKISFSHPQKSFQNHDKITPLHLQEHALLNHRNAKESAIKIIAAKQPIEDFWLCRYIVQRRIEKSVINSSCFEVHFTNGDSDKIYRAIGFKNNAGGYELRNEYFKGSSSPKYITYLDNGANKVTVFEGFFDFISYQTIHQNQQQELTNFLVLNSLSFFERSLLLMEKHQSIHLYLDQDEAGRKSTKLALKRSPNFKDESKLYRGFKDLNDWLVNFGMLKMKKNKRLSLHRHL